MSDYLKENKRRAQEMKKHGYPSHLFTARSTEADKFGKRMKYRHYNPKGNFSHEGWLHNKHRNARARALAKKSRDNKDK